MTEELSKSSNEDWEIVDIQSHSEQVASPNSKGKKGDLVDEEDSMLHVQEPLQSEEQVSQKRKEPIKNVDTNPTQEESQNKIDKKEYDRIMAENKKNLQMLQTEQQDSANLIHQLCNTNEELKKKLNDTAEQRKKDEMLKQQKEKEIAEQLKRNKELQMKTEMEQELAKKEKELVEREKGLVEQEKEMVKREKEKLHQEKLAQEKQQQEKLAQEKRQREKLQQEKLQQEKLLQEKLHQEKLLQEKLRLEEKLRKEEQLHQEKLRLLEKQQQEKQLREKLRLEEKLRQEDRLQKEKLLLQQQNKKNQYSKNDEKKNECWKCQLCGSDNNESVQSCSSCGQMQHHDKNNNSLLTVKEILSTTWKPCEEQEFGWVLQNNSNMPIRIKVKLTRVGNEKEIKICEEGTMMTFEAKANDVMYVIVNARAPSLCGTYRTSWQMTTENNRKIGPILAMELVVKSELSVEREGKVKKMIAELGFSDRDAVVAVLIANKWNVAQAAQDLTDQLQTK